ncbi:GAF domain-containing sensor histidine kinase [Cystobacter ferrugineus]|nr:GAF domain-containing sensor histidine kinase [Cystobacter ferrugineus]
MDLRVRAERAGATLEDVLSLLEATQLLARIREFREVAQRTCSAAKRLSAADGVTFVLSEGENVYYAEEEAPACLWRGRRFPASECISGWAIRHHQPVAIRDIYADSRIPLAAYRPTFVRSLAILPLGHESPVGSLGVYWAHEHAATEREMFLLDVLAEAASAALSHAECWQQVAQFHSRGALPPETPGTGEEPMLMRLMPILAHDLKNPLGAISLAAQSLLRRDGLTERDHTNARRILSSVTRARYLVDEVLEYARLRQMGGLRLDIVPTQMDELARAVVDETRIAFPQRRIELISEQTSGMWDPHRLAEALTNLVGNAAQYGYPDTPITLRVGVRQTESYVEVHNDGPPIPEEILPFIFEPFRRGRGDGRNSVGLGLFIVEQIVRAHGGNIQVCSQAGLGTTFTLHLPTQQMQPIPVRSEPV